MSFYDPDLDFNDDALQRYSRHILLPEIGAIGQARLGKASVLVIGAGGVFKQVLVDYGVGLAMGEAVIGMGMPVAITCIVMEAAGRIIQGTTTVVSLKQIGRAAGRERV